MGKFEFSSVRNVSKNEKKRSLVESIQKNNVCIDFLENMLNEYENFYKYTNKKVDKVKIEIIKWILFNMKYNTSLFKKTLKELGGNPDEIEPVEWE